MIQRWWQYQKERFPIGPYAVLVCALTYAASASGTFTIRTFIAVFIQIFLTFALLRIADEFKDYKEDCAHRAYRPVPCGLITLKQLGITGALFTFCQWLLAFYLGNYWFLLAWWAYFALMSFEFFMPRFLKARPILYLISHMLIMFFFAAFVANGFAPLTTSLIPFALLNFLTALLLEIGRKIRLEVEEEDGVDTYSKLWGRAIALKFWFSICVALTGLVVFYSTVAGYIFIALSIVSLAVFIRPLKTKIIESVSSFWLLALFIAWGYFA